MGVRYVCVCLSVCLSVCLLRSIVSVFVVVILYLVSCSWYLVSDTYLLVFGIWYLISDVLYYSKRGQCRTVQEEHTKACTNTETSSKSSKLSTICLLVRACKITFRCHWSVSYVRVDVYFRKRDTDEKLRHSTMELHQWSHLPILPRVRGIWERGEGIDGIALYGVVWCGVV